MKNTTTSLPTSSKKTKKKQALKTPELRFIEFEDNYEETFLKNIVKIPKKEKITSVDDKKLLTVKLHAKGIEINEGVVPKLSKKGRPYYIRNANEILIGRQNFHNGGIGIVPEELDGGICSNAITSFINNRNIVSIKFLFYYLSRSSYYKRSEKYVGGTGQKEFSEKILLDLKIKIPSLEEQEKISYFLSIMDKKLFLMEKKHSLYVDIKKYFIKNIFHDINEESTDNCLIDNVKWKQLKLKDIIKKGKAGGTPKSSVKKYYNGNIPFLSINDMTKEGKYITYTEKTMSKLGLENSSAWIVPEKSLLYSIYASVGFVSINNIPLATSQAIFSIIFKDDIDLEFMYYHLTFYKKYIHKYIETGTQQNLKAETIKNFKIKIPPLEKQEKISKFLSSIDKYIQIHEQDLNNLKKYKKGLLQKMFI